MNFEHSLSVVAGLLIVGLCFAAPAAAAHHSGAMFDRTLRLEFKGTIKEFQFTNPHAWIQVDVEQEDGETVEWSFEWGSPNQLGRRGIRPSTLPAGAQIRIRTNPMRDGSPAGNFIGIKFNDGTVVGRWED